MVAASFAWMSAGRPLGPAMVRHAALFQAGPPDSFSVGMSGQAGRRVSFMTARILILPASFRARASTTEAVTPPTPPAARSVTAGPAPGAGHPGPPAGSLPPPTRQP